MPGSSPEKKKSVLEELEEFDLDGDLPESVKSMTEDSEDEGKKRVAEAFGHMRRVLRDAKGLIKEQGEELEKSKSSHASPPSSGDGGDQRLQMYLTNLTQRAMHNVGIGDANNPLVTLEVQRLYNEDSVKAQRTVDAKKQAGVTLQQVMDEFQQLDEDDRRTIQERISGLDVLSQADPQVVKAEVHRYMGENFDKFAKAGNSKGKSKKGGVPDGAAVSSAVRSRGSGGVEVGGDGESLPEKPPTPEELKRMRALGIREPSPEQIRLYRRAEAKKSRQPSY